MTIPALTPAHADAMRKLYNADDRTGMYVQYFELTGNKQALYQAEFSSFSSFYGAMSDCANCQIQKIVGEDYPEGGVVPFSNQIAEDLLIRIELDIKQGGTGVFSEDEVFQFAKEVWKKNGLGKYFPGDGLHPFTEGINLGAVVGAACFVQNLMTLGKVYGKSKEMYHDKEDFKWFYKNVHGVDISYAVRKTSGKIEYIERSKHALTANLVEQAVIAAGQGIIGGINIKTEPAAVKQFRESFGLEEKDLSPEDVVLIEKLSSDYKVQKKKFFDAIPFEFLTDAFALLGAAAQAKGNQKLYKVAQVGGQVVGLVKQLSKLPEALSGPMSLAAFHPIMGIAMTLFSIGGLLRHSKEENPLAPVMKQLQGISEQIELLHKEMIKGFNMLAEGQQIIYTTMLNRFHRVEELIQQGHEQLAFSIHQDIGQIESFLTLIHGDITYQIQQLFLQNFKEIDALLKDAISKDKSKVTRRKLLNALGKELVLFENWLINQSGSGMLNGYRYVHFLQEKGVENPELLVNGKLISDGGKHLEYFGGYLGEIARKLLPENTFAQCPVDTLINPEFWAMAADTYLNVLQNLFELGIEHDAQELQLKKIKQKGLGYLEYIKILQQNSKKLFEKLLEMHRSSVESVVKKAGTHYLGNLQKEFSDQNMGSFKTNTQYQFGEAYIKKTVVSPDLHVPILNQFSHYQGVINAEVGKLSDRFSANFEKIVTAAIENQTVEEIIAKFNAPICPVARHKLGTKGGDSYLEMWHVPEHFSHFEDFEFKIPFILTSLFEHAPELKTNIPQVFYLAEMLGLGQIHINAHAFYVGDSSFPDPKHKVLKDCKAFYNYKYTFEVVFITNKKTTKICDFDCHADQIEVSESMVSTAQVCLQNRKRMDAIHRVGNVPEYWFLGIVNVKLNVLSQVSNFRKIHRFSKTISQKDSLVLEGELKESIKNKLNEIKKGYHQFYLTATNRSKLIQDFKGVTSARNLILSFMQMCGYDQKDIEQVKFLWSATNIMLNADIQALGLVDLTPKIEGLLSEGNIQDFFANKDKAALETLTRLINAANPPLNGKGLKVAKIEMLLELLSTVHILKTIPHEEGDIASGVAGQILSALVPLDDDKSKIIVQLAKNTLVILSKNLDFTLSEDDKSAISKKIIKHFSKQKYAQIFKVLDSEHARVNLAKYLADTAIKSPLGIHKSDRKLRSQVIRSGVEYFLQAK